MEPLINQSNDPAARLRDFMFDNIGPDGDIVPPITIATAFASETHDNLEAKFEGNAPGYIYPRHLDQTKALLGGAFAIVERAPAGYPVASGMSAITCAILQICNHGDHIISAKSIYGGTRASLTNLLPEKCNIKTTFVDITKIELVRKAINSKTKVIFCEIQGNPLLDIPNIPELRKLADESGIKLVVDGTFAPMIVSSYSLGAHVVVLSGTKGWNGASDGMSGFIASDEEFISSLISLDEGVEMLMGPVADNFRLSSIYNNLSHLHLRVKQRSANALFIAKKLEALNLKVRYPGLESHEQHNLMNELRNPGFGFGGMLTLDPEDVGIAGKLMELMKKLKLARISVSLEFNNFWLICKPGKSTSSEISSENQADMGLTPSLLRISMDICPNIEEMWERFHSCLKEVKLVD